MGRIEEPLALASRRSIYDYIGEHPGAFVREIERELGMQPGLLSYHLHQLEAGGLVKAHDDGYRRCYFIADSVSPATRQAVALLRQEAVRDILLLLLRDGTMTFGQLIREMRVSKSTMSHHMKRLVAMGFVLVEARNRENHYSLQDKEMVLDAMAVIKMRPAEGAADRFADVWDMLAARGGG
jgi:predicted transcriptional regulator